MDQEQTRAWIKARILENRLKLARAAAVTATVVAAYYIGKSNGRVRLHLYPSDPRKSEVQPVHSLTFER